MSQAPEITTIRNVALIAHGGGGKTTLAESLLFNAGAIKKRGTVERGDTVMTTEPEEVARKITITNHVGHCTWKERSFNLVDTPGYIDFLEATRSALDVVGSAIMLFSGLSGIKPEHERLWRMVQEARIPAIGYINKMDLPRSDFIRALGQIERSLGMSTLPVTIPIGVGEEFSGIVDLVPMTAWSAKEGRFVQIPFPEEARADAEYYRTQLIEKVVEGDDALLEKYLEGEEPTEEQLHAGLREAVLTGRMMLVYCGSALLNIGVRALANGISAYLPSPLDKANIKPLIGVDPADESRQIARRPSAEDPFSAVVFKTTVDPFSGRLSVIRVFSGYLEANQPCLNADRGHKEKGGNLFRLQGKEMLPVERLWAGEIGAVAKLDKTQTGDTLCAVEAPIHYQRVRFLEPSIAYAVATEPKTEEKVSTGLQNLCDEDPTLHFTRDAETKQMILGGMGQTHLEVVLERLKRKYGASATLQAPLVPYRETIRKRVRVQGRLKKQTGGRGQFGDCWIEVEPLPRAGGFEFADQIFGGAIPRQFIPSVEKGVRDALAEGVVGGYPVVDLKVYLVDGSYHSVDSSDQAFRTAGAMALRKALEEGEPVLLEPIMRLEILTPEESMGDVIGDLNSRRGKITGVEPKAGAQRILAEAPMAEVLDYGNMLNALTSGRGLYTMNVITYQEVPSHIARKVLEAKQPSAK